MVLGHYTVLHFASVSAAHSLESNSPIQYKDMCSLFTHFVQENVQLSIKRFREITKNCSTVGTFDKCCDPAIFDFVIGPCHVSGIFLPFSIQPNSAVYLLCKRGNSLLQRNPAHMTRAIVYQNSGGKFKFRRIF
jgi:hypothetical protein